MNTYLLYTVFFIISYAGIIKMLHFSMQEGQWLDKLFDWQMMLLRLDEKGYTALSKWLGGCDMCFCAFTSLFIIPLHVFFLHPFDLFGWWSIAIIWLVWGLQVITSLRLINWK